ncbi:hypothetical protein ACTFIY_012333 [Dictyostelium cf. discoideum]
MCKFTKLKLLGKTKKEFDVSKISVNRIDNNNTKHSPENTDLVIDGLNSQDVRGIGNVFFITIVLPLMNCAAYSGQFIIDHFQIPGCLQLKEVKPKQFVVIDRKNDRLVYCKNYGTLICDAYAASNIMIISEMNHANPDYVIACYDPNHHKVDQDSSLS